MNTRFCLISIAVIAVFTMTACESRCQREMRIDGPSYVSTFVYKFPEGQDLSNNVMIYASLTPSVEGSDLEFRDYIHGYRPIPLHDGYFLDGPIPKLPDSWSIYYMSFTYDDLDRGNVPEDWKTNLKNYIVPCWINANYTPFAELYSYAFCDCDDEPCGYRRSELYNENYTLETPIMEDVHIDTNLLNLWIDNGELHSHMDGGPQYRGAAI